MLARHTHSHIPGSKRMAPHDDRCANRFGRGALFHSHDMRDMSGRGRLRDGLRCGGALPGVLRAAMLNNPPVNGQSVAHNGLLARRAPARVAVTFE